MAKKATTKAAASKKSATKTAKSAKATAKAVATKTVANEEWLTDALAPKTVAPKKAAAKAAADKATRVTFSVRAEVGSKVYIAGSFNDWDPTAKQLIDKDKTGCFTCAMNLKKGRYEYKYVINGTWCADPECTDWVQNNMGTLNSVKVVD